MKNYLKPISMTFMATVLCVSSAQAGPLDIFKKVGEKVGIGSGKKPVPQRPINQQPGQSTQTTQNNNSAANLPTITQGPIQKHSPELAQAIVQLLSAGSLEISGTKIDVQKLQAIYALRQNVAVWTKTGGFSDLGWQIQQVLPSMAIWNGLKPEKYLTEELAQRIDLIAQGGQSTRSLAETEILISQAYWSFLKDVSTGQINPKDPSQNLADFELAKPAEPSATMIAASMYSLSNLYDGADLMAPQFRGYLLLRFSLATLEDSKNSRAWAQFKSYDTIRPGERHENIVKIRGRLVAFGYMGSEESTNQDPTYDYKMISAVEKFQQQHNLVKDGVIGKGTYSVMDKSYSYFRNQIIANMEKWRFYPRGKERFIMVDMGRQELDVMSNGESIMQKRTVVGGEMTGTPTMADKVVSIKLAPDWTSPDSIVINETIPEMGNDPAAYLAKEGITVLTRADEIELSASEINKVDWKQFSKTNAPPYLFRTKMGEHSALGLVKFNLTNKHFIYLHDTGNKKAFDKDERYLSHGCIRVQNPFDLVAYLNPKLDKQTLVDKGITPPVTALDWRQYALNITTTPGAKSETIKVDNIPVYIFGTTTVNYPDNTIAFGKDIYKQDERIINALKLSK